MSEVGAAEGTALAAITSANASAAGRDLEVSVSMLAVYRPPESALIGPWS